MLCLLCGTEITSSNNTAVFDCGHQFHLSCVLHDANRLDHTECIKCKGNNIINLGIDDVISSRAELNSRVRKRMLIPSNSTNWFNKLYFFIVKNFFFVFLFFFFFFF